MSCYQRWLRMARGMRLARAHTTKAIAGRHNAMIANPAHSLISPSKLGELTQRKAPPRGTL